MVRTQPSMHEDMSEISKNQVGLIAMHPDTRAKRFSCNPFHFVSEIASDPSSPGFLPTLYSLTSYAKRHGKSSCCRHLEEFFLQISRFLEKQKIKLNIIKLNLKGRQSLLTNECQVDWFPLESVLGKIACLKMPPGHVNEEVEILDTLGGGN